jgi:hypothetical protein
MSYDPGISGISGASDVFLNNPASNDALSYNNVNAKWQNAPIDKARVGLGNVTNTSDADKAISTATQSALDGKAALAHTHAQTDITGLATALSAKADASSLSAVAISGSYSDLTGTPTGGGTLSTWQGAHRMNMMPLAHTTHPLYIR